MGCTENVIEGMGTEVICHCDTNDCDATVDGPKYDPSILTTTVAALEESGSAKTGSMAMMMMVVVGTAAYLNVS